MGSLKLALEPGAPKRVELTWGLMHKNFQVLLDGKPIATANGSTELRQGISGLMPDGRTLEVKLVRLLTQEQLTVLVEGRPLPGSSSDPQTQVKSAGYLLYLIAGLSALMGVVQLTREGGDVAGGVGTWIAAVAFAVLGYFAMKPSFVAIAIGMVLFAADAVFTLLDQLQAGGNPNVFWLLIRVAFLFVLFTGAKAAKTLKEQPAPSISKG